MTYNTSEFKEVAKDYTNCFDYSHYPSRWKIRKQKENRNEVIAVMLGIAVVATLLAITLALN